MHKHRDWISRWIAITAVIAWILANGLDVFSVWLMLQFGGPLTFARHHPAEYLIIYANMRMLGTLALCLLSVLVNNRWPSVSGTVWSALTACALVTAAFAWWRLYR
jgi:hypothetical protein